MRLLARLVAVLLLTSVAILAVLGFSAPWSSTGWMALAMLLLAALAPLAHQARTRRTILVIAAGGSFVLALLRLVGAASGSIRMVTLPNGGSRWLASIVDEQDVSLLGARILALKWRLPKSERERLLPAMRDSYLAMRRLDSITPSPVLDTALRRNSPDAFDTIVVDARSGSRPNTAVLFLHGWGGAFALECWLMAEASLDIDALTVCPATRLSAHWTDREGERIVRATLDNLEERGVRRVYLAGLSNGAAGALWLAPRFRSSIVGLILISGTPTHATPTRLPTIVLHGNDDPIAPATVARAFASRANATYIGLDAGHFALLVRRTEAREAITRWLRLQESRGREAHDSIPILFSPGDH